MGQTERGEEDIQALNVCGFLRERESAREKEREKEERERERVCHSVSVNVFKVGGEVGVCHLSMFNRHLLQECFKSKK